MVKCHYEGCDVEATSQRGLTFHINATHQSDDPWKDKENMGELYLKNNLSSREIAKKYDISKATVLDWLDRLNINKRQSNQDKPPNYRTSVNGYEEVRSESSDGRDAVFVHRLVAVAEYGTDEVAGRVVHHKNSIPWDNRPSNLVPIERGKHVAHHHEEGDYDEHLSKNHEWRHDNGQLAPRGSADETPSLGGMGR